MAASSSRFANVLEEFLDELLSVACFCHFLLTYWMVYAKTIRLLVLVEDSHLGAASLTIASYKPRTRSLFVN